MVIYDTSNYSDFPVGGQLTSVKNFLTYIAEYQAQYCSRILLVGVTTDEHILGQYSFVNIADKMFAFLPVVYRNANLREIKSSLRIEYIKGIYRYRNMIPKHKAVLHYIHTVEAFAPIKLLNPLAKTIVFSHGTFFDITKSFRFYQGNKVVEFGVNFFLKLVLILSNRLFVLDDKTYQEYKKYNSNVTKVNNSVVLPIGKYQRKNIHNPVNLLYVGRLSKVKGLDGIIKAVEDYPYDIRFTIVGDGEEYENLQSIVKTSRVVFIGAVAPSDVKQKMLAADILIMNSTQEGKPMTIIEAMSYGLPIITTDVGGISEMVDYGKNGEKTNGTVRGIIDAIGITIANYNKYSQASFDKAGLYDYRIVNKSIFECLMNEIS